jgi:hypothetical protein
MIERIGDEEDVFHQAFFLAVPGAAAATGISGAMLPEAAMSLPGGAFSSCVRPSLGNRIGRLCREAGSTRLSTI